MEIDLRKLIYGNPRRSASPDPTGDGARDLISPLHRVAEGYGGKGLLIPATATDQDILDTLKEAQVNAI